MGSDVLVSLAALDPLCLGEQLSAELIGTISLPFGILSRGEGTK